MNLIATLTTDPSKKTLTNQYARLAAESVGSSDISWLADNIACDISLPNDVVDPLAKLREALNALPIDIFVQPVENRRKMLLIADMDSTMIEQECIDELAEIAGIGEAVSRITSRAMAGELDFEQALRQRLALLKGLPVTKLVEVIRERITLTPGGRELVQTMKANGAETELISGGFTQFTAWVARKCGFDDHQANQLEIKEGHLTGLPLEPILGEKAKLRALTQSTMMKGLTFSQSLAIGDGANDIAMIKRAGLGVAFHAKPIVQEAAGATINHSDLTALLYLQGYTIDEFKS